MGEGYISPQVEEQARILGYRSPGEGSKIGGSCISFTTSSPIHIRPPAQNPERIHRGTLDTITHSLYYYKSQTVINTPRGVFGRKKKGYPLTPRRVQVILVEKESKMEKVLKKVEPSKANIFRVEKLEGEKVRVVLNSKSLGIVTKFNFEWAPGGTFAKVELIANLKTFGELNPDDSDSRTTVLVRKNLEEQPDGSLEKVSRVFLNDMELEGVYDVECRGADDVHPKVCLTFKDAVLSIKEEPPQGLKGLFEV